MFTNPIMQETLLLMLKQGSGSTGLGEVLKAFYVKQKQLDKEEDKKVKAIVEDNIPW